MRQFFSKLNSAFAYLTKGGKNRSKVARPGRLAEANLEHALRNIPSVFFVQVGAHDGVSGDPLRGLLMNHKSWEGIFVEPVPSLFEHLQMNYDHSSRFTFENVAVAKQAGRRSFFYVGDEAFVASPSLPRWCNQLGSFDKEHLLKHLEGQLEPYLREEQIMCLPLDDILARNKVSRLDLLVVDTEGADYEVLSSLDIGKWRPAVIVYEHRHLDRSTKRLAQELLDRHGYSLSESRYDVLAVAGR